MTWSTGGLLLGPGGTWMYRCAREGVPALRL